MGISAVLFDLDNTLIDRPRQLTKYSGEFAVRFEEELEPVGVGELDSIIQEADGGGYRPKEEMFAELERNLAWRRVPAREEIRAHWYECSPLCSVEMEGASRLLGKLREQGLKLGIVTNGTEQGQSAKIEVLGLAELVDAIVISESVGVKKPDPGIFSAAVKTIGVEAGEMVFVGDHPRNDVLGAIEFGMSAVWLRGSHAWPEGVGRVHSIDKLEQIENYMGITT